MAQNRANQEIMNKNEKIVGIVFAALVISILGVGCWYVRSNEKKAPKVEDTNPYMVHTRIWEGCEYIAINRTPYIHKGNCTNHAGIK